MPQELRDRLEQPEVVLRGSRGQWSGVTELGQQPGELGSPDTPESVPRRSISSSQAAAESVHPWAEGENLSALVRPAHENGKAAAAREGAQLLHDPGLADSRLTHDGHDCPAPSPGRTEKLTQLTQFGLTPN